MKRVAILISGNGTTAQATIKACQDNTLTGIQPFAISSNSEAKGNEKVGNLGITPHIIDRKKLGKEEFDKKLLLVLDELQIDFISLQGWLLLISPAIVAKYKGRIMNQHPGPLDPGRPDFGGKGMSTPYRVNCAILAYVWATGSDAWTESDTHFVTEDFDMGDLIRTEKMSIPSKKEKITIDTLRKNPEELMKTTHQVQKEFYPVEHKNVIASLQMYADGTMKGFKRKQPLIPKENVSILQEAKKLALELFPPFNL